LIEQVGGDSAHMREVSSANNVSRQAATHFAACPAAANGGGVASISSSTLDRLPFTEIWAVDFEFGADPGENPEPVCLIAWELRSGRKLRLWRDEFGSLPPYPTGPDVLFVATASGAGLLGALAHFALDGIGAVVMPDLILRGGPWTDAERRAILD
jgi:hypothetical protein